MSSRCGESSKWTTEALRRGIIKCAPEVGNGFFGLSFSVVPFGPSHVRIGAIGPGFIGFPHFSFRSRFSPFFKFNMYQQKKWLS
jgi:hypothetical protein